MISNYTKGVQWKKKMANNSQISKYIYKFQITKLL
jgi:hypothetical protein